MKKLVLALLVLASALISSAAHAQSMLDEISDEMYGDGARQMVRVLESLRGNNGALSFVGTEEHGANCELYIGQSFHGLVYQNTGGADSIANPPYIFKDEDLVQANRVTVDPTTHIRTTEFRITTRNSPPNRGESFGVTVRYNGSQFVSGTVIFNRSPYNNTCTITRAVPHDQDRFPESSVIFDP